MPRSLPCFLALFGPVLWANPLAAQSRTAEQILATGSERRALVSFEVVALKRGAGTNEATLKVLHVYSGPKELKGKELRAETGDGGRTSGYLIIPSLSVEETGVARLYYKERESAWQVDGAARKNLMPEYDRYVEWAEAVEALAKNDAIKRLTAARELCAHKNPRVARLGIAVLFDAPPDDAKRAGLGTFVAELPDAKNVSPAALARADELLVERDRDRRTWRDSESRKRLLARMVEPMGEQDAESVADHLIRGVCIVSTHGAWFTADEALGLMHKITTDPRQPLAARNAAVDRVLRAGGGAAVPEFTFAVLAGTVRRGPDTAGRLHAAKGLGGYVWSAAERETLLALHRDEKDDDVRQALDAALKKVK